MESYKDYGKSIDFLRFYVKIFWISKDYAETKQVDCAQRKGKWCEPFAWIACKPFPASPGMTGTGSSRYRAAKMPHMRRIRVVPRLTSPLTQGAGFIFL